MHAPVLLVTFNRPFNTAKVLEKIRQAGVQELYIFNDGPRQGNEEDVKAREEIKQLIGHIDWPCQVSVNFSVKNLGCGAGPSAAVSWAFEHVNRLIVLEDDCVPVMPFFSFCSDMLERYRHDSRVWMVSGNNYNEEYPLNESYTFSHNAIHTYGWATWKRCWNEFDINMDRWPAFYKANGFESLFRTAAEARFWNKKYRKLYQDRANITQHAWDFQFVLTIFMNAGLVIVPAKNLVTNIGYTGVHNDSRNESHDKRTDPDFKVVSHPPFILVNGGYDQYHWKHCWMKKAPVSRRIRKKLMKLFK